MKRYGGDLNKAIGILLLCCLACVVLFLPVLWGFVAPQNEATIFSIPYSWAYGLIALPVLLVAIINFAWRNFDRTNR